MIYFRRLELEQELHAADWRLRVVLSELALEADRADLDVQVTSVWRSDQETRAIYAAAGKPAPAASVHGTTPVRGVDMVPRCRRHPARAPTELDPLCAAVSAKVNLRIQYPRGKRAVVWHDIGAGAHWHCQVSFDGLVLVADPLKPRLTPQEV